MRGRLMWISGAAFLLAFVGVLVIFVRGWPAAGEAGDRVGSIGGFVVAAVSLVVGVVTRRSAKNVADDDPAVLLERAGEELARLVDAQWRREAQWRGLLHPGPMRVAWSSTTRPVSAPASDIVPIPGVRATQLRLNGYIGEVADTWRQLPARQLVVIGAPAAGKTTLAMLFLREVLSGRRPGDPVPVLLNLAGWDPVTTHLDTWIARRLVADYPQLTARRSFGEDAAVRLVDRRRVIPVLDGLDEMPEAVRPLAVAALNQTVAGDRPLVLTCRTDEFEATIAASGTPLGRAAVVELAPLNEDVIAEYLPTGQVDGAARWSAVLTRLRAQPDGVLAKALSNPLTAYMARTAYATPDTDPGELLTFDTVTEVEEHLFETYLPMIYRPRLPAPDEEPPRPYRTEETRKWLSFIASQLHQKGKRTFCLWRLEDIQPSFTRSVRILLRSWRGLLLVGGLALLSVTAVFAVRSGWVLQSTGIAAVSWLFFMRKSVSSPARVRFRPVRVGLGLAMWIGLGALLGNIDFLAAELAGLEPMVVAALFTFVLTTIGGMVVIGLIDASPSRAVLSPAIVLRKDREAVIAVLLAGVGMMLTLLGVAADLVSSLTLDAVAAGLILGLAGCLAFNVGRAWANWVTDRVWLTLLGSLPWRLLPFIEDAHRRGVLRAVGTEYQFRHVRLQEYLATHGVDAD